MKFKNLTSSLFSHVGLLLRRLIQRWGIDKKMRRLQVSADRHPRRAVLIICGTLLFSFGVTLATALAGDTPSSEEFLPLGGMEEVGTLLGTKQRLDEIKHRQSEDLRQIIDQGQTLRHDLDSLMALPSKSSGDSLEIYRKHKQLSAIVNYLDAHEKD